VQQGKYLHRKPDQEESSPKTSSQAGLGSRLIREAQRTVPEEHIRKYDAWFRLPNDARTVLDRSFEERLPNQWIWNRKWKQIEPGSASECFILWPKQHQTAFLQVHRKLKEVGVWKDIQFVVTVYTKPTGQNPGIRYITSNKVQLMDAKITSTGVLSYGPLRSPRGTRWIKSQVPTVVERLYRPWFSLPQGAKTLLRRSFRLRKSNQWIWKSKVKKIHKNNWGKTSTAAYSFYLWSPRHQRAFNRLYHAMSAAGLWGQVYNMLEVFVGSAGNVPGMKFVPFNKASLLSLLLTKSFCREPDIALRVVRRITNEKGSFPPKWRQVVRPGTEGLHIIDRGKSFIEVHIDDIAPVAGRTSSGACTYSVESLLPHAMWDLKGKHRWRNVGIKISPKRKQFRILLRIPGT
jgi:hypothetical protein